MKPPLLLTLHNERFSFSWDLRADQARLLGSSGDKLIWKGSLLPLWWLTDSNGEKHAIKARVDATRSEVTPAGADLFFDLGEFGHGRLLVGANSAGVRFEKLEVNWTTPRPPAIDTLYFGAAMMTADERSGAPTLDRPFWPDWRAEGYGVASAKPAPMQSFFRSWDFGHTTIPLGSFGPAQGTPYAAAFPRPIYAGCMGGRHGWICFGAGEVPDAALSLIVRARSGAVEWRYREDLWGPPATLHRTWDRPLQITWAETAWQAYRDNFRLCPQVASRAAEHQKSFWGTWGDMRLGRFDLRASIDRACDEIGADVLCFDEPWELSKGSCRPHPGRFPRFGDDVAYARNRGIGIGIWMPIGWLADPTAAGLTADDLILNRDGVPARANWAIDPREASPPSFCLDPSSARARQFVRERTQRVMRDYRPSLLKIDFGYGLPGPDGGVPRDPAFRGERLAWELARLIADAARECDPEVTIFGYSIHPLWDVVQDQCSLDDLGDAGAYEAAGHRHWTIWASLLGDRGQAIMGSSGYEWEIDDDVILDSAILGAPGANLPSVTTEDLPVDTAKIARRRAVHRWHRRSTFWQPAWLDSAVGSIGREPSANTFGRIEMIAGCAALTAVALREPTPTALAAPELRGMRWLGRWLVLAQTDDSIFGSNLVALIPFDIGEIELPRDKPPRTVRAVYQDNEEDFQGWSWISGRVCIRISVMKSLPPLLGLLVE